MIQSVNAGIPADDPNEIPEGVFPSGETPFVNLGRDWRPTQQHEHLQKQAATGHDNRDSGGDSPGASTNGGSKMSTTVIYPWYIVCDESVSMSGDPIDAVNEALPELHAEIASNPVIAHKTRLCIIAFSDDASVVLPLSNLADIDATPILEVRGGTSYAAAFRLLRSQIEADMQMLGTSGQRVARPAVFFFTDGGPTDGPGEWEAAYADLINPSFKWHPNIVGFAVGDGANNETIKAIATKQGLAARAGLSPAKALAEFVGLLTKSMVQSVNAGTPADDPDEIPEGVFPSGGTTFVDLGSENQIGG